MSSVSVHTHSADGSGITADAGHYIAVHHNVLSATPVVSCPAQVLEAMAQSPSQAVRRRFFQLRVMDYITRELCLEMELAAADPLKGGGSSTSAAHSGRSSGLPTPSALQVPTKGA